MNPCLSPISAKKTSGATCLCGVLLHHAMTRRDVTQIHCDFLISHAISPALCKNPSACTPASSSQTFAGCSILRMQRRPLTTQLDHTYKRPVFQQHLRTTDDSRYPRSINYVFLDEIFVRNHYDINITDLLLVITASKYHRTP